MKAKNPPFVCEGQIPRVECGSSIPRCNRAAESVSLYFLPLLPTLPYAPDNKDLSQESHDGKSFNRLSYHYFSKAR